MRKHETAAPTVPPAYAATTPATNAGRAFPGARREIGSVRTGQLMLLAAFAGVLALMTMFFDSTLERQINPNQDVDSRTDSRGVTEVVLQHNRGGHYVASGAINGKPTVFLLDTGATDVAVPADLARRLGLKRGVPGSARTANGTVTTYRTRLDRVELGGIVLENVRASINPGFEGEEILLGMSFLRQLELVQRDGTLTLRQFPK